jgi:general secretion pathway protein A
MPALPVAPADPAPGPAPSPGAPALPAAPAVLPLSPVPTTGLWRSEDPQAWRALLGPWRVDPGAGDPCTGALAAGLQCYRTDRLTLEGLMALGRPGIVLLRQGTASGAALVTGVDAEAVTLQTADGPWRVRRDDFARAWRGDFATVWRLPPGQRGRLTDGRTGAAGDWLDQQLVALQARQAIPATARTTAERLEAFQRSQGIDARGPAGPITFMQLNRAAGVDEPRLTGTAR